MKPSNPTVQCPEMYHGGFLEPRRASTRISIAELFVTVNNWKPLNCLSTEDWLNKIVIYLCNRISKNTVMKKEKAGCRIMGTENFFFLKHIPHNNVIYHFYVCINIICIVYEI